MSIAGDLKELEEILVRCVSDREFLCYPVNNALDLVKKNHNIQKNAEEFKRIIEQVVLHKKIY